MFAFLLISLLSTLIKQELKRWVKINPTDYLFFDKNKNKLNQVNNITHNFNKIFDKNISINTTKRGQLSFEGFRTFFIFGRQRICKKYCHVPPPVRDLVNKALPKPSKVQRRVNSVPSLGGTRGYDVHFRYYQLVQHANGEEVKASTRSIRRWKKRINPHEMTGNVRENAIPGR